MREYDNTLAYSASQLLAGNDLTAGAWTKVRTSVAQDINGPELVKGYTITRTDATGNSSVRRTATTTRATHVTFSLFARKGTLDILRLWANIGARYYTPLDDVFKLDENWRLYSVTIPKVPTATVVEYWVVPGTTTGVLGTIEVAEVRVVESDFPCQVLPRLDTGIIPTASLPAAGVAQDGRILIEDAGAGDRNLIVYAGAQRFRIDGGAAF